MGRHTSDVKFLTVYIAVVLLFATAVYFHGGPVPAEEPPKPIVAFKPTVLVCQDASGQPALSNNTMMHHFGGHNIVRAVDSAGAEYMVVIPTGFVCRITKQ